MTQWLQERYISRAEHQQIVAYYKKLVVQLYGALRDLRAQADHPPAKTGGTDGQRAKDWIKIQPRAAAPPLSGGGNVIHLEFHRRH